MKFNFETVNGAHAFIPYGRQLLDESDIEAVIAVLRSDWLTQGPRVEEFEGAFAEYVGSQYAVAVSSGTAALHIACHAADLGPGDEVITSPITFAASANCALYVGARPSFVDIDPETFNLDPVKLEVYLQGSPPSKSGSPSKDEARSAFTVDRSPTGNRKTADGQRTTDWTPRAIIPVHFAGLPCDMVSINKTARQHNLIIIEDACHALGSKYQNEGNEWVKVGSCKHSDMTVFSFHPVKHITTGEGGMITTNSSELASRLRKLRNHGITRDPKEFTDYSPPLADKSHPITSGRHPSDNGQRSTVNGQQVFPPWYYEMQDLGFNYRITDIQCALGSSQLGKIDSFVSRRREIAARYTSLIADITKMKSQVCSGRFSSSYHLYPICLDGSGRMSRDEFMTELKKKGVGSQVHYIPVYRQPFYQKMGYEILPQAELFFSSCLSLPMYPGMSDSDIAGVLDALRALARRL